MFNLVVSDLHVDVLTEEGPKQIPKGVDLIVNSGEMHAIMGPNGSGKSTLAYAIVGHPEYEITSGPVTFDGVELTDPTVDERARQGLLLAIQHPVEVPGVSAANLLRTAKIALDGKAPKIRTWTKDVEDVLNRMNLNGSFPACSINKGFSGGERKHHETVQLELLSPRAAILDETGSGLNTDALRIAFEGINRYLVQGDRVVMLITHYIRILRCVDPTFVHVFVDGRVVDQGGHELADKPEVGGYEAHVKAAAANIRAAPGSGNGNRRRRGPK